MDNDGNYNNVDTYNLTLKIRDNDKDIIMIKMIVELMLTMLYNALVTATLSFLLMFFFSYHFGQSRCIKFNISK